VYPRPRSPGSREERHAWASVASLLVGASHTPLIRAAQPACPCRPQRAPWATAGCKRSRPRDHRATSPPELRAHWRAPLRPVARQPHRTADSLMLPSLMDSVVGTHMVHSFESRFPHGNEPSGCAIGLRPVHSLMDLPPSVPPRGVASWARRRLGAGVGGHPLPPPQLSRFAPHLTDPSQGRGGASVDHTATLPCLPAPCLPVSHLWMTSA